MPVHPANRHPLVGWLKQPESSPHTYEFEVLKGVRGYIEKHGDWTFEQVPAKLSPREWSQWNGDGLLVLKIENKSVTAIRQHIRQLHVPVVDVSAARLVPAWSWVESDNPAVGKMAAEHLLERGLQHFGFCGFRGRGHNYSQWRQDGFVRRIQQAGFPCAVCSLDAPPMPFRTNALIRWLAALPKPAGIMGDPSELAREILTACRRLKLAIPDDAAVITVNSGLDPGVLESPPLSCVKLNMYRVGYEAAALLDRLMSGAREPPGTAHLITPLDVETRQSTDLLAIPDPHVAAALRYIWQHACEGIQTKDILQAVPLSRRLLEYRFRKFTGRTLHEEVIRMRIRQARKLLEGTDLSLAAIAERSGFPHAQYLVGKFHRETGLPPGEYRTRHAGKRHLHS